MEPSGTGGRTLEQAVVHWRSVALVGACLAGGLTLTVMVIGSTPEVGGSVSAAAEAVVADAVAADPSITVAVETTAVTPDSTEVPVAAAQELLAAPAVVGTATVAPVAAPLAAPVSVQTTAPLAPAPSPQIAPATPVLTPAPTLPPPTAPPTTPPTPQTTAPPTTTPPPPTTAAPPAAPALTYPAYTVSGVAGVSLRFDGSSISVASVSPQANWVYEVATNGPRTVEIKFFNVATGSDREFHATVEGGRITVET